MSTGMYECVCIYVWIEREGKKEKEREIYIYQRQAYFFQKVHSTNSKNKA